MPDREKITEIIKKEIVLEDDMLSLYTLILKKEPALKELKANDKEMVVQIIDILLRDTARHKKMMSEILKK